MLHWIRDYWRRWFTPIPETRLECLRRMLQEDRPPSDQQDWPSERGSWRDRWGTQLGNNRYWNPRLW